MLITIGKCQVLLHPRDAPGSLPRKVFCLAFSSWKDDRMEGGSDEEKDGTKQVTTSSTKKNPNKTNPLRKERNMRLAASYPNRNITASVCI